VRPTFSAGGGGGGSARRQRRATTGWPYVVAGTVVDIASLGMLNKAQLAGYERAAAVRSSPSYPSRQPARFSGTSGPPRRRAAGTAMMRGPAGRERGLPAEVRRR
jgi:hypothetical protein